MEVSEAVVGVFYVARIFGLAPYLIKRKNKGNMQLHRSIFFSIYSPILAVVLVILTYRGLLYDANSEIPLRASFRMKSATSKVVTALDVSVVVFACMAGVVCGLIGLRQTQELNRRLREADETLSVYTDEIKDRRRGYLMLVSVLLVITGMLCMDIWAWLRMANKMRKGMENTELNVQWYIPFYSLYYILMGLHIHFAQSALGLGRRYRRLNLALKNSFKEETRSSGQLIRVTSLKTVSQTVDMLPAKNAKKPPQMAGVGVSVNGKIVQLIDRLAYTHESLGKAIETVSGAFGIAVLCMLGSCLLHLVATAYFMFLELIRVGDKDAMFSWLQILWLLFHLMRLLLIVEPCHVTTMEANKTISIVCEIKRNVKDNAVSAGMKKFWQQLLSDRPNFSACGMCKIDRQILTSFSGAMATYLVILIQFQKTDG